MYKKVRKFVKLQVASNLLLYQLWFFLYRSRIGTRVPLPTSDYDLYFDGFQRSGNTFSVWLLRNVLKGDIKFSHHLHAVAGIKLALRNRIPTYILIRKPIDAIASFVIMQEYYKRGSFDDKAFIEEIIIRYTHYYSYVHKRQRQIRIVPFEELINAPVKLVGELAAKFDLDSNHTSLQKTYHTEIHRFRDRQKRKPAQRTSLPNKEREQLKEEVKNKILQSDYFPEAQDIYDKIANLKEEPAA